MGAVFDVVVGAPTLLWLILVVGLGSALFSG